MVSRTRKRLAQWLDPDLAQAQSQPTQAVGAGPAAPAVDAWTPVAQQFAWRVLASSYQASTHLGAAEEVEEDEERLERLYRIDHALTRIRRQAENLQVLSGLTIEDAARQVTTLLDIVRAAASAIERFAQVHVGRVADLAVVEFAADDVIRIVTELLDNATHFSPATEPVTVSAHLTDWGGVLLRIEDSGVGIASDRLPVLNASLSDLGAPPQLPVSGQVGLVVAQRLAAAHKMRVQLTARRPSGTTATLLLPAELICEVPMDGSAAIPSPRPRLRSVPVPEAGSETDALPARRTPSSGEWDMPATSASDLPRRNPESTRIEKPVVGAAPLDAPSWPDEAGDFAAGFAEARAQQAEIAEDVAR